MDEEIRFEIPTRPDTAAHIRHQRYGPIFENDWAPMLISGGFERLGKDPNYLVYLIGSLDWNAELRLIAETLQQVREWSDVFRESAKGAFDVAGLALMHWKDRHPDSSKLAYMTSGDGRALNWIPWKEMEEATDA